MQINYFVTTLGTKKEPANGFLRYEVVSYEHGTTCLWTNKAQSEQRELYKTCQFIGLVVVMPFG